MHYHLPVTLAWISFKLLANLDFRASTQKINVKLKHHTEVSEKLTTTSTFLNHAVFVDGCLSSPSWQRNSSQK
jgi:hypothetical protein